MSVLRSVWGELPSKPIFNCFEKAHFNSRLNDKDETDSEQSDLENARKYGFFPELVAFDDYVRTDDEVTTSQIIS